MRFCPVCRHCYENNDTVCLQGDGAPLKDWPQRKDPSQESWLSGPCQLTERYRLVRLISSGGMGTIFEGIDKNLDRPVAIKILHRFAHLTDPDALERFRREARAASRVNDPNVAVVHDYGVAPEWGTFIIMELIEGENLARLLKAKGRLPIHIACQIAQQIANGISALHRAGFVHRDLKPSNVIITFYDEDEGLVQIKVVDFGIVKAIKPIEGDEPTPTNPGVYVGTPSYMSPEHCANKELDARSDIYSLGILLFQMLAGRKPFVCNDGEDLILFSKHLTEQPPLLTEFIPDTPEGLEQLVYKALEKKPSDRPQSAKEFARALRAFTWPDTEASPVVGCPERAATTHPEQSAADADPETQTMVRTPTSDEGLSEPEMHRIADIIEEGLRVEVRAADETSMPAEPDHIPPPQRDGGWDELERIYSSQASVSGRVMRRVKKGLLVDLGGITGFLPNSQVDTHYVADFDNFVNQEIEAKIIKLDRDRSDVILSRRALLEEQAAVHKRQAFERLKEGDNIEGRIQHLTDYGAFVDLGGFDGLLHISEMSWTRPQSPAELFEVGDTVKVKILKIDREHGRISLGRKQLLPDPWKTVRERFAVGSRISGRVREISDFEVSVEIEDGLIGFVHISEISRTRYITHPGEVLKQGQDVEAIIIGIDPDIHRLSLSIKELDQDPWEAFVSKYKPGDFMRGKVTRFISFGAFIELEGGIEGLCHITQLSDRRVDKPEDAVQLGQEADFKVLRIDRQTEKIDLSLRPNARPEHCDPLGSNQHSGSSHTSSKVRVYDLAKELRLDSIRLIEELRYEGVNVSLGSNSISQELANKIRDRYFLKKDASAPRKVVMVKRSRSAVVEEASAPIAQPRPVIVRQVRKIAPEARAQAAPAMPNVVTPPANTSVREAPKMSSQPAPLQIAPAARAEAPVPHAISQTPPAQSPGEILIVNKVSLPEVSTGTPHPATEEKLAGANAAESVPQAATSTRGQKKKIVVPIALKNVESAQTENPEKHNSTSAQDNQDKASNVGSIEEPAESAQVVTVGEPSGERELPGERVIHGTVVRRTGEGIIVDFGFSERLISWDKFVPESYEKIVAPTKGQMVEAVVTGTDTMEGFTFVSQFRTLPLNEVLADNVAQPACLGRQPSEWASTQQGKVPPDISGSKVIATAFLTSAFIVAIIAGAIFLLFNLFTGSSQSSSDITSSSTGAAYTENVVCAVGSQCEVTLDSNLRAAAGKYDDQGLENERIGLAALGSTVEVLEIDSVRKNWRKVKILQHGRQKKNPIWVDEGWMDGSNLRPSSNP